jgi:hypothetical protein
MNFSDEIAARPVRLGRREVAFLASPKSSYTSGVVIILDAGISSHKQQAPDSAAATDQPPHPCPCCGGRMIIIETFEHGSTPRYRPQILRTRQKQ